MSVLAGLQVLLGRYAGQSDFAVATPIANRNRSETEGLIGFFVNQLVLRADLHGDPTFLELLARVREVTLGAYAHQDVPFEKVVEELAPERSVNRAPLFQVMLMLQNAPQQSLELPGLTVAAFGGGPELIKLDLRLVLQETPDGLAGSLDFSSDLFSRSTMAGFVEQLVALFGSIVDDPARHVSELSILSPGSRARVIEASAGGVVDYAVAPGVHHAIARQAEAAPDAIALVHEHQHVTYEQLEWRANQLARYLQGLGIGPEVRVGLAADRGVDLIAGMLGIMKSGGAYVPVDADHPMERVAYLLRDAQPAVLLTHERLRKKLPSTWAQVVCLDSDWDEIARFEGAPADSRVISDQLAYIIYTSGSTGRPKGVGVTHAALANCTETLARGFAIGREDRGFQFVSPTFDAFGSEVLPVLAGGGALVLHQSPGTLSPAAFWTLIARQQITTVHLPPHYWSQVVDHLETGGDTPDGVALRLLVSGGDVQPLDKLRGWPAASGARTRFVNAYGPTEATVTATQFEVALPSPMREPFARLPIGQPIANVRVYVLDARGEPTPPGLPGELCIGGAGVARGYLNAPDATAGVFVPDRFADRAGARMYRTGDLARWRGDGLLEFMGRVDDQVKVRGYRIEPGEVEAILGQHAGLRECVVVARHDGRDGARLVAYVVPLTSPGPSSRELREHLQTQLPDYMLPSAFIPLDALPRTHVGKLDRTALPALEDVQERSHAHVPPVTEVERTLAEIWAQVLDMPCVGLEDSFFDLGGHSLLATQVVSRVRTVFGIELPLRVLFETPTFGRIAAIVSELMAVSTDAASVGVPTEVPQDASDRFFAARLDHLSEEELDAIIDSVTRS